MRRVISRTRARITLFKTARQLVLDSCENLMRILQISSAREMGGGERHLADLANSLVKRGHDVFVALASGSPVRAELSSVAQENIIELSMRNALSLASAVKLSRFVRENRIDVVHAHLARDYPLAALASGRSGARLVLTRHVLFPLSKIHRLTLGRVARVIAVSKAVADALCAQAIFAPAKIVTIHNGIDIERFVKPSRSTAASARRKLRVGTTGQWTPIKGQEDFIRAAAIVCATPADVEFVIVGWDKSAAGENRKFLATLIHRLNVDERVSLVGRVDDMPALLATLDVFVSTGRVEAFGLSIVEAMAAGIPVIATESAGAREILKGDLTGRLVPVGDVEAIAGAIIDLLKDPSERERLAQQAQADAREHYSLDRMVYETERVYRDVLKAG